MSKISKIALPEEQMTFQTEDGKDVEISIKGIKNREIIGPMTKMEKGENTGDAELELEGIFDLVHITLQKDDPDTTLEDVKDAPFAHMWEIIEAIMRVNNMEDFMDEDDEGRLKQKLQSAR